MNPGIERLRASLPADLRERVEKQFAEVTAKWEPWGTRYTGSGMGRQAGPEELARANEAHAAANAAVTPMEHVGHNGRRKDVREPDKPRTFGDAICKYCNQGFVKRFPLAVACPLQACRGKYNEELKNRPKKVRPTVAQCAARGHVKRWLSVGKATTGKMEARERCPLCGKTRKKLASV